MTTDPLFERSMTERSARLRAALDAADAPPGPARPAIDDATAEPTGRTEPPVDGGRPVE